MRGLLVKDFYLTKDVNKSFVLILILAMFVGVIGNSTDFVMGFVSIIGVIFGINTISYDDFNHSTTFLMTLPCTRKQYAIEKYIFSILSGIIALCVGMVICFGISMIKGEPLSEELVIEIGTAIALQVFLLSIIIPVTLKFGADKGKIFIIAIFIIVAGGVGIAMNLIGKDLNYIDTLIENFMNIPHLWVYALITIIITVIISLLVSIKVMEKKQF